jgi:hypothetical protein
VTVLSHETVPEAANELAEDALDAGRFTGGSGRLAELRRLRQQAPTRAPPNGSTRGAS